MIAKRCGRCKKTLPISKFNPSKHTKDGYNCYCRWCKAMYQTEWRRKNAEKVAKYREQEKELYQGYKPLYKTETHKECGTCGVVKPRKDFQMNGSYETRHCKVCYSKISSEYRRLKAKREGREMRLPMKETETHKECGCCGKMLPKSKFSKYTNLDKLNRRCKDCVNIRQRTIYRRNSKIKAR